MPSFDKPLINLEEEQEQLISLRKDDSSKLICGTLIFFFKEYKRFPEEGDEEFLRQIIQSVSCVLNIASLKDQDIVGQCLDYKHRTIRQFNVSVTIKSPGCGP